MKKSDLDFIYNVVCPVCGSKPSYQATGIRPDGGITTYTQKTCVHKELKELIKCREDELDNRLQK
ncbi:hypothetical protein B0A56_00850 [Flavobacterium columnare NBRC 100251 = ATCC 23463]|nr:hypothetical protein B0A56_00850 [Flavobacterium columnare NBRC 100251 = ATCC 23463]